MGLRMILLFLLLVKTNQPQVAAQVTDGNIDMSVADYDYSTQDDVPLTDSNNNVPTVGNSPQEAATTGVSNNINSVPGTTSVDTGDNSVDGDGGSDNSVGGDGGSDNSVTDGNDTTNSGYTTQSGILTVTIVIASVFMAMYIN